MATKAATWATLPMGAPAGANSFWELFRLPAGGSHWALATPPDVATNGALALASLGGTALAAGVRPSLYLDFSPVTGTSNDGTTWTARPPNPGLASVPDALAAGPAGQLLALGRDARVELSTPRGTEWTRLASTRKVAAAAAGRACGLTALTAVAYAPAGQPLLAGNCARPGVAGIFTYRDRAWKAAGPPLPSSLATAPVQVLRLTTAGSRNVALLLAGRGPSARLLAAWSATGKDGAWTVSAPAPVAGARLTSTAIGSDGALAVSVAGGRAAAIPGPSGTWRALPALPAGRAVTLALPPGGGLTALTATGSDLAVWRLDGAQHAWTRTQVMKVPIQYGSSS